MPQHRNDIYNTNVYKLDEFMYHCPALYGFLINRNPNVCVCVHVCKLELENVYSTFYIVEQQSANITNSSGDPY